MKKLLSIIICIAILSFGSTAYAQITKDQYYARSTLEENELEFYDHVYDRMTNEHSRVYPENYDITEERAREIISYVFNDSPELWNYDGRFTDEEIEGFNAELAKTSEEIINMVSDNASDYEKVQTVYEYLGNGIQYVDSENQHSIIGGLVERKATCGGISDSLQYILYQLDIRALTVISTPEQAHAWNIIEIDGNWYYADLTNDLLSIKAGTMVYFLKDDSFLRFNHPSESLNPPLPACTSKKYMEPVQAPTPEPTPEPTVLSVTIEETPPSDSTSPVWWFIVVGAVIAVIMVIKKRVRR